MTVTFLPIIGCRQHGEVYFQLNITRSPLNRLEYKSSTKWAFAKWNRSASAPSRCAQASLTRFHQCWQTPSLLPVWEAGCPSLREIFRSQLAAHLPLRSLEACCFQVCLWEHWSAAVFLEAWIPENLNYLLSAQNKDQIGLQQKWQLTGDCCIPRTHFTDLYQGPLTSTKGRTNTRAVFRAVLSWI